MIQPTQVLPSNASPLRNDDNVYQASRILQEHSGNRQQTDFSFGDEYNPKYSSSILTENHFSIGHQQPYQQAQVPQLYHPQPRLRQQWRYGYTRGGHRHNAPEEEARVRYDAERLYNRFRKSDQYVKYRNRQTKDDKNNDDQKWPDHLEKAFFRALVQWPPMGRRKYFWKEKQRGRNELIADCIEELTGEGRTRKQVSSHIQVLKPFVDQDPYIMKWLAKEDMGATARVHGSSAYHTGRRMSNYPVMAPPQGAQTSARPLPRMDLQTIRKAKASLNVFEPVDFSMFVQRKFKVSKEFDRLETLHTYTKSSDVPLDLDRHLEDLHAFERDYPLLAAMHAQRPMDCNILDAEASIAFTTKTWKKEDGTPMEGVELGIHFLCTSQHLPPTPCYSTPRDRAYQIIVVNNFYENGIYSKDHSGASEVRLEAAERESYVETRVKFGSTFWARTLQRLAGRLLDPNRDHRDEVDAHLRNINAVQEVILRSEQGHERLLVIHWKFRLSSAVKGRASWRRVILPTHNSNYGTTIKDGRVDSMYDYNHITEPSTSQQHAPAQLALQSPFEYESSFGSTLSSATWPTSLSDVDGTGQQHDGAMEFGMDNTFDFNGGNINFSYDPSLTFDNFDSSAFNFDTTAADFAADPALQDYSQQWYDGYANAFGDQQALAGTDSFAAQTDLHGHAPTFECSGHYDATAHVASQDQAYGGAVADMTKDKDALAALADASYIASALVTKQEPL